MYITEPDSTINAKKIQESGDFFFGYFGLKRTKAGRERWHGCSAGGCRKVENLTIPKPLRTGTGAIRQESFMLSHLSAPQTQGVWPFVCPVLRGSGTLRFSHTSADARRTHRPPAPGCFLCFEDARWRVFSFSNGGRVVGCV